MPRTGVALKPLPAHPVETLRDFYNCRRRLWTDRLGQISLSATTLFWGAGATLQFIVIEWARVALDYNLSRAAILQGVVALGIALGAVVTSLRVSLYRAVGVIPLGIGMGLLIIVMNFVGNVVVAIPLLIVMGALAGYFAMPMNALLQHRGHNLMGAGRSIAVQNFNENGSILLMIALYSAMLGAGLSIYAVIVVFGLFIAGIMALVLLWYRRNRRVHRDEIEALLEFARSEKH